jgi:hypothetical protein
MDELIAVGAQLRYQIKMVLESFKDPFFYEISKEEFERISERLENSDSLFLVFSTTDGRTIAVARSAIQFANLLWDGSLPELEIIEHSQEIRMYLKGNPDVFSTSIEDDEELGSLLAMLDTGTFRGEGDSRTHISFVDQDGEQVFINPDHLVLMDAPTHLFDPEQEQSDEQFPN